MADLKLQTIEPPWAGIFTGAGPGKCPPGTAPLVRNFLTHLPGRSKARAGIQEAPYATVNANVTSSEKAIISQVWSFNDKLLISFHRIPAAEAEGYIPPWKAPYWKASEAKLLAKPAKKLAYINLTTGTMEELAIEEEHRAPGSNGERLGKYVYGFSYDAEKTEEINGGFQGLRPFLRWDGTKSKPTVYEKAPKSGQAVKSHLNRIWCLGGTDPTAAELVELGTGVVTAEGEGIGDPYITKPGTNIGQLKVGDTLYWKDKGAAVHEETVVNIIKEASGTYHIRTETEFIEGEAGITFYLKIASIGIEANSLFYTDQYGPTTDSVEFWKDDVSGLVNRIIVGDDNQNDFGVSLAVVNQALIIFKRHSIWALYGYSPTTFAIRNITSERGCIDPASVCEVDGGVYFASQRGIEFFDGSQFRTISDPIKDVYDLRSRYFVGEKNDSASPKNVWGQITIADIGNDYLMVVFGGQSLNTGFQGQVSEKNITLYCHAPTGNWAQFTCSVLGGQKAAMYVNSTIAIPWVWDGLYITPIYGMMSERLNSSVDLLHGTIRHVPAKFISDRIELAAPSGYMVQLHRFLFDYAYGDGTPATDKGWYVKLLNGDNTTAMEEQQVPVNTMRPHYLDGFGTGNSFLYGRRFEFDDFNEATDLQLIVERREEGAPSFTPSEMEVYDTVIEYQISRQRRST